MAEAPKLPTDKVRIEFASSYDKGVHATRVGFRCCLWHLVGHFLPGDAADDAFHTARELWDMQGLDQSPWHLVRNCDGSQLHAKGTIEGLKLGASGCCDIKLLHPGETAEEEDLASDIKLPVVAHSTLLQVSTFG